jgi:hypothetical protein
MLALTLLSERDHREGEIAAKERKERKNEGQEKLTQSRLFASATVRPRENGSWVENFPWAEEFKKLEGRP